MLNRSKLLSLLTAGAIITATQGCESTPPLSKPCQDPTSTPSLYDSHRVPHCNPTPPISGESATAYGVNNVGNIIVGQSSSSEGPRGIAWIALGESITKRKYEPNAPNVNSTVYDVSGNTDVVIGTMSKPDRTVGRTIQAASTTFMAPPPRTLQPLPGSSSTNSEAHGVSNDGNVIVGWSTIDGGIPVHAVRWKDGSMQDLGVLDGRSSKAHDTNSDGTVVVGERRAADGSNHAFSWVEGRTPRPMKDLTSLGGNSSKAYGVNGNGTVIVGTSANEQGKFRAVRWHQGSIQNLGVLHEADHAFSDALDVNTDGTVVVGRSSAEGGAIHAFRWVEGRTPNPMEDLGTLPNHTYSQAFAVSADGSVVVGESGTYDPAEGFKRHAFLWKEGEGMQELGSLP